VKEKKEEKDDKDDKDEKAEHVQFEDTPQILPSELPIQVSLTVYFIYILVTHLKKNYKQFIKFKHDLCYGL